MNPSLSISNKEVQFLSQETTTLIVKNLPDYSEPDLLDFLKHYGPQNIRLGKSPQLKNSAFLDFPDRLSATNAFYKIQELGDICGKRIRVEYALPSKETLKNNCNGGENSTEMNETRETNQTNQTSQTSQTSNRNDEPMPPPPPPPIPPTPGSGLYAEPIAPSLGVNYPSNPTLHYRYPPPTVETLQNIMNAITAVPKLYTQVLHLMNKMNLPPPFGPVVPESIPSLLKQDDEKEVNKKRRKKDELLSEDESEIDSENEEDLKQLKRNSRKKIKTSSSNVPLLVQPLNTLNTSQSSPSLLNATTNVMSSTPTQFYDMSMNVGMNIGMNAGMNAGINSGMNVVGIDATSTSSSSSLSNHLTIKQSSKSTNNCITIEEINKNKMPIEELQKISVMKNYSPGEPNRNLYIKNLVPKKVEEKDLEYLFGRYFNSHSEMKSNLEIILMKEGRMRGQAFIKFPTEEQATQALNELHGYLLHDKPMVIHFSSKVQSKG
ncbi:hypothetical protein Glove_326g137 [Diversispora epigaea]|uniref:RNA-binding region-containing protein 3 n=1 Tax=Diversispora epigaea TaxID=1348612 RepID=A0A397HSK4_9GLOM|nr:hypothetical protein Glove_326g137 [Diversispora epigaea]